VDTSVCVLKPILTGCAICIDIVVDGAVIASGTELLGAVADTEAEAVYAAEADGFGLAAEFGAAGGGGLRRTCWRRTFAGEGHSC
jgi:hypothetical protein